MRTRQTMTISLPPAMVRDVDRVRKAESRTRSELVREALRRYFSGGFPVVTPTPTDLTAIRRARAEIKAGQFVTLEQLLNDMGGVGAARRTKSGKGLPKNPR